MPVHLVLTVTIVVAIAFYVSILNPEAIDFRLTRDFSYQVPLVVVVLAAIFVGALLVALMDVVNASSRGVSNLRASVKNRKFRKLHQSHEKGQLYLEAGYLDEAEEEFQKVLERDPKHVPSLIELGKLKLLKGDHEEALKLHNRAYLLDKRNLDTTFSLADDYMMMGRYQKALSILKNGREVGGNKLVTLTKLREVCIMGQLWEEALKAQKEIVHHSKDKAPAKGEKVILSGIHHELGQRALQEGRSGDALKEFKTILKSERDFAPAYSGMGDAYLAIGKEDEALKAWEEGYNVTSCLSLLKKQEAFFMKREDPGSAISLYRAALEANPNDAAINYLLGLVYLKLEMMAEALQEFKKVEGAGIIVPGMGSLMASIYERTGKQELATQQYRKELGYLEQSFSLYKCASCGNSGPEWKGRCSQCGQWNTYQLNMEKREPSDEKVMPPPPTGV